jgi:hypothetical protein
LHAISAFVYFTKCWGDTNEEDMVSRAYRVYKRDEKYRILVGNPVETYCTLETITLNGVFRNRVWSCGLNSLDCDRVHQCLS